jgi:2-oxopent-4-enoate/cis-2-oxohex-4-enoate hydratase
MKQTDIEAAGEELFAALRSGQVVSPLTERHPAMTVSDAYEVSLRILLARMAQGERVVGKKVGVTSKPVQQMLDVHSPDFGYLTDAMVLRSGEAVVTSRLIQPRIEAEIAFFLKKDLKGPGVNAAQVASAIDCALPCLEIVDSRIRDWKIRIQDTVADNASCGFVVLGTHPVNTRGVDLSLIGCVVEKNGELLSTGAGAAALGSPLNSVAWLANTLATHGVGLLAGEIVLSGALVPLEPVKSGDVVTARFDRLGSVSTRFA